MPNESLLSFELRAMHQVFSSSDGCILIMIRRGVEKRKGQRFSVMNGQSQTYSTKCEHKIPVKQWSTFGCYGDIFSLARTQSALGGPSIFSISWWI